MSSLSIACYFPWSRIKVASQSVDEKAELSQINIVPDLRYKPLCHKCDCDKGKIHKWHHRAVRDLNFAKAKVFLNVRYRSLSCPRCGGTGVEKLEFVEPRKRITKRLANYIRDLCRKLPVSQVAEHLDLDWKTVKNIDKTFLEKEYGETDYEDLRILAVDEIALRKGHTYMTVVLDYETGRVVWVGKDRKSRTLKCFFDGMTKEQKASIEAIAMDMWDPYIKAVRESLPGSVQIVFDLFHVVSAFNKIIDKVRNAEYKKAKGKLKQVLKGSKYLLLRNTVRRQKPREKLKQILELNETISTMLILKEMLKQIWRYK